MKHLAALIPWRGSDPKTYPLRTKHFINALKVRLEFVFPYQYIRIQRNEAHVRLMSSLWYGTRALLRLSAIGLAIGLSLFIAIHSKSNNWWPFTQIYAFASPMLIFILAFVVKGQIERFLHYQRIREIVFILEATFFAERVHPGMFYPIILEDKNIIVPPSADS